MITVVVVVCMAVAAWIVVDFLLARRDERLQRGSGAWSSQFSAGRRFHATGFEDTQSPAAEEPALKPARRFAR